MSFDEIISELKAQKKRIHKTNIEVAESTGIHVNTVRKMMHGENCELYKFLDLIDELGMELSVDEMEVER